MEYEHSAEQAAEYLRLALTELAQRGLRPNPINLTLAYEYCSGNGSLCEVIDKLNGEPGGWTEEASRSIYKRFVYDDERRLLEELKDDLRRIVTEILKGVGDAYQRTTQSTEIVERQSRKLDGTNSIDEIHAIIGEVVRETRDIARNGHMLKDMLSETRHEIEELRSELEAAKREAKVDTLTGVLNRRAFEVQLEAAVSKAREQREDLSLLMLDIDHFKRVNDSHGHLVGDKVLRAVSGLLRDNVKGRDTVARYGGEEFAIILPDTQLKNALLLGESIRRKVERVRLRRTDTATLIGEITISVGATAYRGREDVEEFIHRADTALYKSKSRGRNKVTSLV